MRPVERSRGIGHLFIGDRHIKEVTYTIGVSQELHYPRPGQPPVPGMLHIDVGISGLNFAEQDDLSREDLTLVLEDGRKLPIGLTPDGQTYTRGDFF